MTAQMDNFKTLPPEKLQENVFKLLDKDWMLITAGTGEDFNTMTAAWGGFGILWNKRVSYIFIRPTRYTYEFTEKNDIFTLSFFPESYRKALTLLGTKSGRDGDKVAEAGLTPLEIKPWAMAFQEARMVIINKKIYYQDLEPSRFLDTGIDTHYPEKDYHRLYIGEITEILTR